MRVHLFAASIAAGLCLGMVAIAGCSAGAASAGTGTAGTMGTAGTTGTAGTSGGAGTGGTAGTAVTQSAPFEGIWKGGWLSTDGQLGNAKLTTTLTGTTVGGSAEMDGSPKSDLTGTFAAGNFMGSYRATATYTFDLNLTGSFLVGRYAGGTVDTVTTMLAATAAPAPATAPAKLVGTWKSLKSARAGSITITSVPGDGTLTATVAAPGLAESDVFLGYADGAMAGGNTLIHLQLLGSGSRFVGGFSDGTEVGVIDAAVQ